MLVYLELVATNTETTHLEVIAAVHDEKRTASQECSRCLPEDEPLIADDAA